MMTHTKKSGCIDNEIKHTSTFALPKSHILTWCV